MSAQQGRVIIVGSGPAGSTLALALGRAGIEVVLLERGTSLPVDLRASTFHPPSLDMLDDLGVAQAMVARGLPVSRYQYRDKQTGDVAEFDMSVIADLTRHPFRLQLEQYEMTRIISAELAKLPTVTHRFGASVSHVEQDESGVRVIVDGAVIEGAFLVGADGASSIVRKALGIGFGGFTYDEKFLVASTSFPFETVLENLALVNYVSDPHDWAVILRTEKLWRVLWPTEPDVDDAHYLSDAHIEARLQALHPREEAYDIGHRTLYHVHQRVAETYVKGRATLIGDAAHINNPLGGMGMNGGLHDAVNLAEKLVKIIHNGGDYDAHLGLFDRQRRLTATAFVQKHTIDNKKLMEAKDAATQASRQAMFMATAADPTKARAFVRERAMIDCVEQSLAIT
jgi:3-(3-hydroxy-phenyl)propionate hydroxylase